MFCALPVEAQELYQLCPRICEDSTYYNPTNTGYPGLTVQFKGDTFGRAQDQEGCEPCKNCGSVFDLSWEEPDPDYSISIINCLGQETVLQGSFADVRHTLAASCGDEDCFTVVVELQLGAEEIVVGFESWSLVCACP